jgi:hypothetical protein
MATQAQLKAARNAALKLADATQPYAQGDTILTVEASAGPRAVIKAAADAAIVACAAIGGTGSGTSAAVSNGATINVENSAGNLDSPGTAVVAGGLVTSVQLAATKTILTNALKFSGVTITGTGTFFTPTIVNGVLTGGVLSAS